MKKKLKSELLEIVNRWNDNKLSELDVLNKSEQILENIKGYSYEPDSIELKILHNLEILHHQLITKQDIPFILECINADKERNKETLSKWDNYLDKIDYEERRRVLKNNPFYSI